MSSSANAEQVLQVAGLSAFIDHRVDGVVAKQRGLPGKPAPDTFLAAAADLGVPKEQAVVFEDALAGVASGRAGGFGYVVEIGRAHVELQSLAVISYAVFCLDRKSVV